MQTKEPAKYAWIRISPETKADLKSIGKKGQTYDDIITILIGYFTIPSEHHKDVI